MSATYTHQPDDDDDGDDGDDGEDGDCEDDASKDVQKVSQRSVRTTHADLIDIFKKYPDDECSDGASNEMVMVLLG